MSIFNKIEKYYVNKKKYLVIFILVLGLSVDLIPQQQEMPQDPPQDYVVIHSSIVSGGSDSTFTITASWPATELRSTVRLDWKGNGYFAEHRSKTINL